VTNLPFKPTSFVPGGAKVIDLCVFRDELIVALDIGVYRMVGDELHPIKFAPEAAK
jgi:hypothetical protein